MAAKFVRVCNFCGESSPAWAKLCVGCGASTEDAPLRRTGVTLKIPPAMTLGILLCFLAFGLLWTMRQNSLAQIGSAGPKPLKVLWHKFYGNRGEEWVVGDVKNQGTRVLKQVYAYADFYTEDGVPVQVARAPLQPADLAPGQVAHFRVTTPFNRQWDIQKSWFHFQTPQGEQVGFER